MGVGGQSHASAALTPGKRPGTHCTGDWVGPRAGLDSCGKRPGTHCTGDWVGPRAGLDSCAKYRPYWDLIPGPSTSQQVAIPTELL